MNRVNHQERIVRFFDRIRVLTADLLENFSVKKFTEFLSQKDQLISSIRYEMDAQRPADSMEQSFATYSANVKRCLNEIRALDIKVMDIMRVKTDEIRGKLKGLSKSAPAALAYSHHKRL